MADDSISIADIFGLSPAGVRWEETKFALKGDALTPKTRWGLSSLKIFAPRLSVETWLGRRRSDRRVPLYNLFNRTPTPIEDGWSVRKTQVRDYRGGTLTYDSHNGTDFAVTPGTPVTAPASGYVIRVSSEFHRGGLKVFIDHGDGLATSCNHLARSFVKPGTEVRRGQTIALSGASGIDNIVGFPWTAPHVHFNVFLNGRHVDPYAEVGSDETSLWIGDEPLPAEQEEAPVRSEYDVEKIAELIDGCRDPELKAQLRAMPSDQDRGDALLFQTTYFATRFRARPSLYRQTFERSPRLSLPFRGQDFVGAAYPE